jgi:hypothetical protein
MPEKPLVEGRGVLRLWQVADLTGIREHDVAALVESGAIVGGLVDKDGRAFGIFEDEVPSRDLLLTLGAHAVDDSDATPAQHEPGEGEAPSWEIRW